MCAMSVVLPLIMPTSGRGKCVKALFSLMNDRIRTPLAGGCRLALCHSAWVVLVLEVALGDDEGEPCDFLRPDRLGQRHFGNFERIRNVLRKACEDFAHGALTFPRE